MSFTLQGLLVAILGSLLTKFGIPNVPEQVAQVVSALITIGGWVAVWWGRYRQGGITWYGKKLG